MDSNPVLFWKQDTKNDFNQLTVTNRVSKQVLMFSAMYQIWTNLKRLNERKKNIVGVALQSFRYRLRQPLFITTSVCRYGSDVFCSRYPVKLQDDLRQQEGRGRVWQQVHFPQLPADLVRRRLAGRTALRSPLHTLRRRGELNFLIIFIKISFPERRFNIFVCSALSWAVQNIKSYTEMQSTSTLHKLYV